MLVNCTTGNLWSHKFPLNTARLIMPDIVSDLLLLCIACPCHPFWVPYYQTILPLHVSKFPLFPLNASLDSLLLILFTCSYSQVHSIPIQLLSYPLHSPCCALLEPLCCSCTDHLHSPPCTLMCPPFPSVCTQISSVPLLEYSDLLWSFQHLFGADFSPLGKLTSSHPSFSQQVPSDSLCWPSSMLRSRPPFCGCSVPMGSTMISLTLPLCTHHAPSCCHSRLPRTLTSLFFPFQKCLTAVQCLFHTSNIFKRLGSLWNTAEEWKMVNLSEVVTHVVQGWD